MTSTKSNFDDGGPLPIGDSIDDAGVVPGKCPCGKPTMVGVYGEHRIVFPCADCQEDIAQAEARDRLRKCRAEWDEAHKGASFSHLSQNAIALIQPIIQRISPYHVLTLYGPSGCGKSYAARIIQGYAEFMGYTTMWVHEDRWGPSIQGMYPSERMGVVQQCYPPECLIWDDYCITSEGREYADMVIKHRADRKRLTVITTNLDPSDPNTSIDPRIARRMTSQRSGAAYVEWGERLWRKPEKSWVEE